MTVDLQKRPAPSPSKLIDQFNDWAGETELPGRTMSYLKTGFLPELLVAQQEKSDEDGKIAAMLESWAGWEKGKTRPEIVLAVLDDNDVVGLLTELSG